MLSLSLMLVLGADAVHPPPPSPPPSDMAILYFLAGDLRRAVDTARGGLKGNDAKKCKVLFPMLVEYEFLIPKREEFTLEQARQFLEYDKKISPQAQSKLTLQVVKRYVDLPLQTARTAQKGGDLARARKFVGDALAVDPASKDALELQAQLGAADAGR